MNQPYQIGQTVYVAMADAHHNEDVPCPVCAGALRVTVILGDGEHVSTPCRFCERGYLGSQGVVAMYRAHSAVCKCEVSGVVREYGKWRISLAPPVYGSSLDNIFTDETAAEARRAVLFKEAEATANASREQRITGGRHDKDYSWSIGYHRRKMRHHQRSLEWHRDKVQIIEAEHGAGDCPHCGKGFKNVPRHVERQHPEAATP